jgi:hypothetical protein
VEDIMEVANQTMGSLAMGVGLFLVMVGAWALVQELLPVALQ